MPDKPQRDANGHFAPTDAPDPAKKKQGDAAPRPRRPRAVQKPNSKPGLEVPKPKPAPPVPPLARAGALTAVVPAPPGSPGVMHGYVPQPPPAPPTGGAAQPSRFAAPSAPVLTRGAPVRAR